MLEGGKEGLLRLHPWGVRNTRGHKMWHKCRENLAGMLDKSIQCSEQKERFSKSPKRNRDS